VTNMSNMFSECYTNAFNQDINAWDVGNVTNMSQMFYINKGMTFGLNSWNTSKVTTMSNMFYQSVFNGNIGNWNVSAVQNMAGMFQQSPINQDLSSWNFRGLNATANFDGFMNSVTSFSTINYNALLISMNNNKSSGPYRSDLRPNFGSSRYYGSTSAAATARAALVTYGWTITDGGTTSDVPDAPTSVSGTAGDAQVSLTWTAPIYTNGAAISDYTIQYSSNSGSSWDTFAHAASSSPSITVTGLTNNTAYIFRVAAVNSVGTGSYSTNSSSITPIAQSFTPTAVLLTSGASYTVPVGATSMKAWVVGGGGGANGTASLAGGAGGCSYRTYSVTGGSSVTYSIGAAGNNTPTSGGNTTVTHEGVTITGSGGQVSGGGDNAGSGGTFSGGDGGSNGGAGVIGDGYSNFYGGAVGGNAAVTIACNRRPASDVSGLFAALALAGSSTTATCVSRTTAAFGAGAGVGKYVLSHDAGLGGGSVNYQGYGYGLAGAGAVVLYFT
jgi:hypothetical protein